MLRYAHCVKFTTGKPDVAPYSQYELREVELQVEIIPADPEHDLLADYLVTMNGMHLACDNNERCALGEAEYKLMHESRRLQVV